MENLEYGEERYHFGIDKSKDKELALFYDIIVKNTVIELFLDEAFNNMTSDRIEPMMNMFKKLNLQLVLIATAEKATKNWFWQRKIVQAGSSKSD